MSEIEKHRVKIEALQYGQVVFIVHGGMLVRGQLVENFETAKPLAGSRSQKCFTV
jgi:hypothetical protein